jgi:hypothetical protein
MVHDLSEDHEPKESRVGAYSGNSLEVQLLLACSRTTIDESTARQIKSLLNRKINWVYLRDKAHRHGVMPLLYRSLESTFPELVPRDVLDSLRGSFQRNALNNLVRTRELLNVLQLLEPRGIPALPFKGPLLALQAYGHLELRQFSDLDILVQKRHVHKVKGLLFAQGYSLAIPLPWISKVIPALAPGKDLVFVSDDEKIVIELHWRLTGRHFDLPIDMKGLWRRLVPISYAGATIKSLPLEDLLLYLCMHGSRHSWERLAWICDVAELIRLNQEMNWNKLLDQSAILGSERMLALGLLLASDLLGAKLPADVSERIRDDPKVTLVAARVCDLLFEKEYDFLDISYWYHHHLMMRERFRDRARLYLYYLSRYVRLALTPNAQDHELLLLPKSLSFIYYILRPVRLTKERGSLICKAVVKKVFLQQ